jgi:predicted lipid-binding transport protein (Tim44 family)
MESGGFPIDLILFGMIAAFLVLRLRGILGRRQGFERTTTTPLRGGPGAATATIDGTAEPAAPGGRPLPDPLLPTGRELTRMQTVDRGFQPARFLDGAEQAFRLIVTAFAGGDRKTLAGLLTPDTLATFEGSIAAREAAGETQRTEVRAIRAATIEAATLVGTLADITVRFVSDQISLTTGRDGNPVAGTDALTEMIDLWVFRRDLSKPDPTWRLAAARSA